MIFNIGSSLVSNKVKVFKNAGFLLVVVWLLNVTVFGHEIKDNTDNDGCMSSSSSALSEKTFKTLVVGVFSSIVFGLIGILPALFIRTDKDEEKFSI
jgi:hypothetical protein